MRGKAYSPVGYPFPANIETKHDEGKISLAVRALKMRLQEIFLPRRKFKVWKTITIGGFQNVDQLCEKLKKNGVKRSVFKSYESVDEILRMVTLATEKSEIDLVIVSLSDLSLGRKASFKDIERRAKVLGGLCECTIEDALQLGWQYKNQPEWVWLIFMTEPIAVSTGDLVRLTMGTNEEGDGPWLTTNHYSYYSECFESCTSHFFVFRLPPAVKKSNLVQRLGDFYQQLISGKKR